MMSSNIYVVVVERKLNEEPMRGFRDQSLLIHGSDRMDRMYRMDHEIDNMHHWASPSCEGLTS